MLNFSVISFSIKGEGGKSYALLKVAVSEVFTNHLFSYVVNNRFLQKET